MLAGQFKDVTELLKKTFLCARVSQKERTVNHTKEILSISNAIPPSTARSRCEQLQAVPFVLNDTVIGSEWRAKRHRMTASFVLYDRACISCQ